MLSLIFFCNISSYDILAYITKNNIALIYYTKIVHVLFQFHAGRVAVQNLENYLEWTCNPSDSDVYLFRYLTKSKDHFIFRKDSKPLSHTRMRELFIEAFSSFAPNIKLFGLHSVRAGGATAACNINISYILFKRHERWKSATAKDDYVKDSFSDRILVYAHYIITHVLNTLK
jgi:hypothetical protein